MEPAENIAPLQGATNPLTPTLSPGVPGARGQPQAKTENRQPMNVREFRKTGHWPTLLSAFLYFDVSFMVWVMLGPLAVYISKALELPAEDMFTLVAIPILCGALLRIPMGLLADALGPKRTGQLGQLIVMTGV